MTNKFIQETREIIVSIVDGSGSSSGYISVWHLPHLAGFCLPRSLGQRILKGIDLERSDSWRRHRLRRSIYRNPGPNYACHIDGKDMLKLFDFAIHDAIDDYSK